MQEVYNKDSIIVPLKCGTVQYLGSTLINQNSIQKEIGSRLKDRECLLSSGTEFLSSSLLSNNNIACCFVWV